MGKRQVFELIAAAATGLGKLLFIDYLNWKMQFIIVAILFWVTYLFINYRKDKSRLQYWGFTRKNFGRSFKKLFPYVLLSVLAFMAYGIYTKNIILSWHIIPILLLYPIWGVIQQYLVMSLVAGNLNDQTKVVIPKWLIVLLTAFLFAIIHYPSLGLIIGTFFLAIVYTFEYLKERNLYVLGIYHGWLGCFFYFFALNRDPYLEVFGKLLN